MAWRTWSAILGGAVLGGAVGFLAGREVGPAAAPAEAAPPAATAATEAGRTGPASAPEVDPALARLPKPEPIPEFVARGLGWLAEAQHQDGGWGAGAHARQNVRDPHAVPTDPATTSFVGLALIRAGHTPTEGAYRSNVRRAIEYVVASIEASGDGERITAVSGTQPQQKLGAHIDTALAVQLLSRAVPLMAEGDALTRRADVALDVAIEKLQAVQAEDGSFRQGSWAGDLQSAMGSNAFELAAGAAGKQIDPAALERARAYQKGNFDADSGTVRADRAAGIALYAFAGAGRGAAAEARAARDLIDREKAAGRLEPDAPIDATTLSEVVSGPKAKALADAFRMVEKQAERLDDERLLAGFGNNGGEEYLSYMMTSEALVLQGGEAWETWHAKMRERLAKVQSPDGSWTGHHCITSPVFCTAAVVQALTADRDAATLLEISKKDREDAPADAGTGTSR